MIRTGTNSFALGFVHKRLGAAVKGFVTSGFNPLAAVGGFLAGGNGERRPTRPPRRPPPPRRPLGNGFVPQRQLPARRAVARTETARPSAESAREQEAGRAVKFAGEAIPVAPVTRTRRIAIAADLPCIFPARRAPDGSCKIFLGDRPGPDRPSPGRPRPREERMPHPGPIGDAVMGRFGAALVPGSRMIDRAVCLRGMVLGEDGLCYNRGQIRNSQRMWPKGAKPLGTPEEMRALRIASTFGRRMERSLERLQDIGLLKKAPPKRRPKKK